MLELIYCSQVEPSLELAGVYNILKQSQGLNAARQITGVLLFNTRYFLQVLEGLESEIDPLYKRIAADQRHVNVQLISRLPLTQRHWSQWSMALVTPCISNQIIMRKYCGTEEFNPTGLNAETARGLMQELSKLSMIS
jgi:Sensors of blue-light using FAD